MTDEIQRLPDLLNEVHRLTRRSHEAGIEIVPAAEAVRGLAELIA